MSLATRCPSCATVFRVVQDQLRVSEGWVRCGRCNGVFNAAEVLFDIDSGATVEADMSLPGTAVDAPRASPAPASAPRAGLIAAPPPAARPLAVPGSAPGSAAGSTPGSAAESAFGSAAPATAAPAWSGDRQEPRFDVTAPADAAWPRDEHAEEPLLRAPSRHHDDLADEIFITDHLPTPAPPPLPGPAAPPTALADEANVRADFSVTAAVTASAAARAGAASSAAQALPSFLRSAERNALWRRPAMRAAAGLGVALLVVALVLQAAVLWRDVLAAHWPASTPALTALCRLAGCSVQPLRRIESLVVHSSGLNRLEGSTLYRLQVVLQNRADTPVMMPALELTLNDAQGKLVARRVLQAADMGAPQAVLQAGEELPIKALVATGERRVDGYTLELFYP